MYLKLVHDLNLTPTEIKKAIFLYKQKEKTTHIKKTEILTMLQDYYKNKKQLRYFYKLYHDISNEINSVDNQIITYNQYSMSDNNIIFLLKKHINWKPVK